MNQASCGMYIPEPYGLDMHNINHRHSFPSIFSIYHWHHIIPYSTLVKSHGFLLKAYPDSTTKPSGHPRHPRPSEASERRRWGRCTCRRTSSRPRPRCQGAAARSSGCCLGGARAGRGGMGYWILGWNIMYIWNVCRQLCICTSICMCVCIYLPIHLSFCLSIYISIYLCTCIYIYIYMYIYI